MSGLPTTRQQTSTERVIPVNSCRNLEKKAPQPYSCLAMLSGERIVIFGRLMQCSGVDMLKLFLAFSLTIPLCGHCQSYADSPFYKTTTAVPSTARVEGYEHGSIKANGVVIDLSESVPSSSPDFDEIRGWSVGAWVDRNNPAHTFHFYIQYDRLNPVVVFGYDLLVEPVKGTDKIKCTFSALTDPENRMTVRNKDVVPVALSADLDR